MTASTLLHRLVLVSTFLAMCAAIASEGLGVVWVALLLLALAGWIVTEPRSKSRPLWEGLPRWIANVLLVLALLLSASRMLTGEAPVSVFMMFLAAMLVIKLWQRRELRDVGQALTLSLFLTLGATLNRNDIGVGICMLLQVPVLLAGAMLFQLALARARANAPNAGADTSKEWAALRRPLLINYAAGLLVAGALGVVVFLVTPRGISNLTRMGTFGQPAISRVSGLSSQIDLNQGGLISQSPRIVLTASLKDQRTDESIGSPDRLMYLRALVLETYANGRWTVTPAEDTEIRKVPDGVNGQVTIGAASSPFGETRLRVRSLTPLRIRDPILSLWRPSGIAIPPEPANAEAVIEYSPKRSLIIFQGSQTNRPITEYEVAQVTQPILRARSRRGEVSWPDPAVRAFAEEALREAGADPDPQTRSPDADASAVRVLEAWLRTRCEYTLEPPIPPVTTDPIQWFLTTGKRGHCEYFAASLAALARSVGIDARVVGGYLTNEFDANRQEYTVRDSDAHAWVEAEIAPGLWRTYDATPEARAEYRRPAPSGLLSMLSGLGSSINNFWNTNVVSFDRQSQERLLGFRTPDRSFADQAWLTRLLSPPSPGAEPPLFSTMARTARLVAMWLALFLAAFMIFALTNAILRKRRRTASRDGWSFARSAKLRARRRQLLRRAAAAGLTKQPHESLAALALRATDPAQRDELAQRARELYAARFARP